MRMYTQVLGTAPEPLPGHVHVAPGHTLAIGGNVCNICL